MGLRGAIVGYGFIASQGHLPTYLRRREAGDVDIVGAAEPDEARRDACAYNLKSARTYVDWRTLSGRESGKVGSVDIATPRRAQEALMCVRLIEACHEAVRQFGREVQVRQGGEFHP